MKAWDNVPPSTVENVAVLTAATAAMNALIVGFGHDELFRQLKQASAMSYDAIVKQMDNLAKGSTHRVTVLNHTRALTAAMAEYIQFVKTRNSNTLQQNSETINALLDKIHAQSLAALAIFRDAI